MVRKRLLNFSVDKCKTMHFGHANPEFSYELNGKKLDRSSEERYLGVIVCVLWGKYKWTSKEHMYVGVGNNLLVIFYRGWK